MLLLIRFSYCGSVRWLVIHWIDWEGIEGEDFKVFSCVNSIFRGIGWEKLELDSIRGVVYTTCLSLVLTE